MLLLVLERFGPKDASLWDNDASLVVGGGVLTWQQVTVYVVSVIFCGRRIHLRSKSAFVSSRRVGGRLL